MEMDKEKRVPPDRQKEAEQQLPPEVEAKMNELSPKAFAIADQTIAAYGKPVEEYDDIDRATMAGLIFGEICALAYENGFARLGWFNGTITAIAYQKLRTTSYPLCGLNSSSGRSNCLVSPKNSSSCILSSMLIINSL